MGALAGVGGTIGGVTGALIGLGMPEYEAKRYEDTIKSGGMLLSVHVDDMEWRRKAKEILESCGARDIATMGEDSFGSDRSADFDRTERPLSDRSTNFGRDDFDSNRRN
jgi:hypothetical protein